MQFLLSTEDDAISILSFAENACDERGPREVCGARNEARHRSGGKRQFLRGSAREPGQKQQGVAGIHRVHERKQSRLWTNTERKQKSKNGASDETQRKSLKDVLVLEEKISEVENEPFEVSEQMRKLTVERRKMEAEELRVSEMSRVGLDGRTVSGAQSSEGEAGLGSVGSAGGSQKKSKAVVQKESADTQDYEPYQWNDMDR